MSKPVKLSSLKADLAREKRGDWIAYPDWPGVEFNVSSLNIPEFATEWGLELQRLNVVHKNNIPESVFLSALGGLLERHILHGWRGLDEAYSPEIASEVMNDPAYRDVILAVQWCGRKISQIEIAYVEGEVKNSGKPSALA